MNEFGTCCVCEGEMETCGLIQLDYKVESESAWGCVQCGLPTEGAVAVVCDACLITHGNKIEDQIKYLINGEERILVPPVENRITHKHDLSLHPEYTGAD